MESDPVEQGGAKNTSAAALATILAKLGRRASFDTEAKAAATVARVSEISCNSLRSAASECVRPSEDGALSIRRNDRESADSGGSDSIDLDTAAAAANTGATG